MELKSKRRDVAIFLLITILGHILFGTISGNLIKMTWSWILNIYSDLLFGGLAELVDFSEDYAILKLFFGGGVSILSVLTLIGAVAVTAYMFYVLWYAVEDYNKICSREGAEHLKTPNYFIVWLLSWLVPFGIYKMYWFYKYGNQMQELGRKRRVDIKNTGKKYLLMLLIPMAAEVVFALIFIIALFAAAGGDGSLGSIGWMVAALLCLFIAAFVEQNIMSYVVWGGWLNSLNLITENYRVTPPDDRTQTVGSVMVLTGQHKNTVIPVREGEEIILGRDSRTQTVGSVMVLTGQYKNAVIPVREGEEIILGRDSSKCHLIFENTHVSRVHCGVRYRRRENVYLITDYSTNGTFFENGQRLPKGQAVSCRRGTRILLGKSGEKFIVR